MKYLIKYFPFYEGAIPGGRSGALSMAESLARYLTASPAMQDIMALVSKGRIRPTEETGKLDKDGNIKAKHWRSRDDSDEANRIKEPMTYKLKKNGDIYFDKNASYRYFGQEAYLIRQENNTYTLRVEENSKLTFEQNYENIEDALRNVWAFFVSRTKEYTVSTKYVQDVTRKLLMDPNKKPFWGEKKTAIEIVQELGIKKLGPEEEGQEANVDMQNVKHLLNETFHILGMSFQLHGNNIQIPTSFGVVSGQDNLLSLMLRGLFNDNDNSGGTYEPPVPAPKDKDKKSKSINGVRIIYPLTKFEDDKGRAGRYYIQPRTTEEAYIQCLKKVYKVYFKHYKNYKFDNLYYAGKSIEDSLIRTFIYNYTSILVNEVSKKGLDVLNEHDIFYKTIFAALTTDANNSLYILSNIIQKSAPAFWDKIKSFDVSGMEAAADMGDMGFADD